MAQAAKRARMDYDEDQRKTVVLKCNTGQTYVVDLAIAQKSKRIVTFLQNLGEDAIRGGPDNNGPVIPLQKVDEGNLKLFLEWAEHHRDREEEDRRLRPREAQLCVEWDRRFAKNLEKDVLFNFLNAVHYLDCPPLRDVLCQAVADMIRGKTREEMRELFGINDPVPTGGEPMEE